MDKYEGIRNLKKLLDEGIISEDEFALEKQKLLNKPEPSNSLFNFLRKSQSADTNPKKIISKKSLVFILIGIIALVVIAIGAYEYKNKTVKEHSKSPILSVKVYFDTDEVYPVHLFYLKNTKQSLMELTISNSALESKNLVVSYGFAETGTLESQTITVAGGSVKEFGISPNPDKLMEQFKTVDAKLIVKVRDEQNNDIYLNTWNLKVHPGDELPWKIKDWDCTELIASWVCPNDESVKELIGKVKSGGNTGRVDKMNDDEFKNLVKAIFNTVRAENIAYIDSTVSFGDGFTQRIRLPYMTMKTKSANSIDGSVLLASLFENVGLRPYIVILPGHVIVGVSRPDSKSKTLFIETTLIGRSKLESLFTFESTFTAATNRGREEYSSAYSKSGTSDSGMFTIIDVSKARQDGVLPFNELQ